ncbi:hypothetical protein OIU85_003581 [Salix viminalis]|uniref:Cobalamin-independent methionine synthase MetE C-terminal/archaeal domain-containing protein n=1 Tax=Salix viminalis TaxID=40686 RepID=A0A9Q0PZG5_SALVM|nr:hypothetical protein OIU85_003581 [Salix viminalis]
MASDIVVYPRMDPKRELKLAQKSFWDGKSSAEYWQKVAADLQVRPDVKFSYASHTGVAEYKEAKAGVTAFGFDVVLGRNIWANDLAASLSNLETLEGIVGKDKLDTNVSARLDAQQKKLNLPVLPTTTIGSFPHTMELRKVRREYIAKKSFPHTMLCDSSFRVTEDDYVKAIMEGFRKGVKLQEEFDIDVLGVKYGPGVYDIHSPRVPSTEEIKHGAGIGPGVFDIHSPRVPSTEEIADGINKMLAVLKTIQVNPDCGLKTRKCTEVKPALKNKLLRSQLVSAK